MEQKQEEKWLTPKEATKVLGVSISTLYKRMSAREIPYYKEVRKCFFKQSELEAYALNQRQRIPTLAELEQEAAAELLKGKYNTKS